MTDVSSPTPNEPTMQDATAISTAAAEAASSSSSAEEARTRTSEAIRETAQQRNVNLSDADVDRIVNGLIAGLEARGAFDEPPAAPTPTSTNSPEDGSVADRNFTSVVDEDEETESTEVPPRKRTFADKFAGR